MIPTKAQIDAIHELGWALGKTYAEIEAACLLSRGSAANVIVVWRQELAKKEGVVNGRIDGAARGAR